MNNPDTNVDRDVVKIGIVRQLVELKEMAG